MAEGGKSSLAMAEGGKSHPLLEELKGKCPAIIL